jgi:hypothetical protein
MEILVNFFSDLVQNRIDYVMVNVLASNSADRGFECHSSQSKYCQCCICCIVHIVGLVRKRCVLKTNIFENHAHVLNRRVIGCGLTPNEQFDFDRTRRR